MKEERTGDKMKEIKYLCLVNTVTPGIKDTLKEVPARSGFYNWLFAFKGDIASYENVVDGTVNLHDYDVVHINLPPIDQVMIFDIRKRLGWNSKTKLVLNNDYVPEVWAQQGIHPEQYWHVQEMADMVFGTEPSQVSHMIPRAKCMPHPSKIEILKHIMPQETEDSFGTIFHWWRGESFNAGYFALKLKKMFPKLRSKLYAYRADKDENVKWSRIMWDNLMPSMDYPDYIDHLCTNKFVYEPTYCHTYGRNSVDLAAIGIPMIGTKNVWSMKHCFPYTSFEHNRLDLHLEAAKKLLTDESFRKKVIDYAQEASEYFNYENSKKRFLDFLEESENDKKEWKH